MSASTSPLISIVIPVYNREKLVVKSIESSINQTYKNIEIIIIDNNSTDKTYEIAKYYSDSYPHITLYKNSMNVGPVRNWIEGIQKANGKFIKLLFSDDWLSNDYIEKTIGHFNDDVGLVFTSALIKKENIDRPYYKLYKKTQEIESSLFLNLMLLTYKTPVSPCCGIFRKSDLLDTLTIKIDSDKHDEYLKFGAGIDILTYLFIAEKYKKVCYVHDTYAHFLEHTNSFTYANSLDKYYIQAFRYFLKSTKKVKFKFFYQLLYTFRIHKVIGFLSNK